MICYRRKLRMTQIATPRWNIISIRQNSVYSPAEDTFLLIDAIEKDLKHLKRNKPLLILEIGPGSGVVISALALIFRSAFCLAVDICKHACRSTLETASLNNVKVNVINGDLLSSLRLNNQVDVLIFNPPYVETPSVEANMDGISRTWAGGIKGREVLDRLLPNISNVLSEKGVFYLLLTKCNEPEDVIRIMREQNIYGSILLKRNVSGEWLYVLKFTKFPHK